MAKLGNHPQTNLPYAMGTKWRGRALASHFGARRIADAVRPAMIALLLGFGAVTMVSAPAAADDKIKQPIAVFSGLDKITGRVITFEVGTNETVQFGSLQITERVCYSRPPTEAPRTDTFIEVDNIDANNDYKRIFTGWMFAGSPSLNALDHPVYDIWLLRCKGPGVLIPDTATNEAPSDQSVEPKSQKAQRAPNGNEADDEDTAAPDNGPIVVGPAPGFVPPAQRRVPTQRFYPSTPAPNSDNGF